MDTVETTELKKLQGFESFFKKANEVLGELTSDFEFKKSDVLRQMSEKFIERQDFIEELSKKYGDDVSVNVSNGEIIKPTKE